MSIKNKKILVLTSCSAKKKKISKPIKARYLYEGVFFKKVKKFATQNNFDLRIISAKYGLISPEILIDYYDIKIKNNNDIENLKKKVIPELKKIINNYDKILLLMGEDYKKVVEPLSNERFIYFFDKKGLGGYKSLINSLLTLKEKFLLKLFFEEKEKIVTIDIVNKFRPRFKPLEVTKR